jgi:hypothetical protein
MAAVLSVALWGFWSAVPRVWCNAPGGHGAVESLFASCCLESGPACPSGEAAAPLHGEEAPEIGSGPSPSAVSSCGAACTDTLLPSDLRPSDRGPVLLAPASGAWGGIRAGMPNQTAPAGGGGILSLHLDASPPPGGGFQTSLRI